MAEPVVLVENFLNRLQFPLHTVVADEEPGGFELWHVADGRRATNDYWTTTTAAGPHTITVTFDKPRAFDMLALDRGHNLGGNILSVTVSDDFFATSTLVSSPLIPNATAPATPLASPGGVRTEEGAWLLRLPAPISAHAVRITIPTLVSALPPIIVGLWVGLAWQSEFLVRDGWSEDRHALVSRQAETPWGWIGRTPPVARREGTLGLKLTDPWQEELARYHIGSHFLEAGRPMWIVMDRNRAERAVLALRTLGVQGFGLAAGWFYQQASVSWLEHEPLRPGSA